MAPRFDYFFRETLIGLRRNGLVALGAISTVFLSLFLLGGTLLIGREVGLVVEQTTANVEVAVYLTDPVDQDTVSLLTEKLTDLPVVAAVDFESKEEACGRYRDLFENQEALVENVSCEALPASLRVKLADPERFAVVAAALEGQPGVDDVVDQREILNRLFAVIRVFRVGVFSVAVIMLIAAAALIANTVRMGLFARRKEIGIMKLVGATNWRIRIPFLIEGIVEALIGAVAAIVCLFAIKVLFVDPLRNQIGFLPLIQNGDVVYVIPWLLGAGIAVAVLASLFAMSRFLDV